MQVLVRIPDRREREWMRAESDRRARQRELETERQRIERVKRAERRARKARDLYPIADKGRTPMGGTTQ